MSRTLPVWRSLLYVPAIQPRFIEKAAERGADAVILDLEDSVPPSEKPRGRAALRDAIPQVARKGADVVVRCNRPLRELVKDLDAAIVPGVRAVALPKLDSAQHVCLIAEMIDELEVERGLPAGGIGIMAMVETAAAFFRMHEIAAAHPRIVSLGLGGEDFALSVDMLPEPEGLFFPKQQSVIAARAAGILPLGFVGSVAEISDLAAFREIIRRSRRLGFAGASCVHPSQIPVLNEEFAPSPADVNYARRMLQCWDETLAKGLGAVTFEGKMIDIPIVERARNLLARHEAIMARHGPRG
jgi:citrate lyase subunit beta/citryl-CoA lyase